MCPHWVSYPSNVCLCRHRTEKLSTMRWPKALHWMNTIPLIIQRINDEERGNSRTVPNRNTYIFPGFYGAEQRDQFSGRKIVLWQEAPYFTSHSMVSLNTLFMEQWHIVNHFKNMKPYRRISPQSRSLWIICRPTVFKTAPSPPPVLLLTVALL